MDVFPIKQKKERAHNLVEKAIKRGSLINPKFVNRAAILENLKMVEAQYKHIMKITINH